MSRSLDRPPTCHRRIAIALAMAALCAIDAPPARSDWPPANLQVAPDAVSRARSVSVSDGAGGEIVVFEEDYRGNVDLYAQRLNANGGRQWNGTNGVAICTAAGSQRFPSIVADGVGGAIIAWQDPRSGTSDIYVQRVNAAGTVLWTANGVALCTAINAQSFPAIAGDGSSGAIVTWLDGRGGVSLDVYARRVNSAGAPQWTADGVAICTAAGNQSNANVIADGGGGAIIAWQDPRGGAGTDDIFAQRVNSAGSTQWIANGLTVCNAAGTQEGPSLISDGSSGTIIAWKDLRGGATYDVYAQRVLSSGSILWAANGLAVCNASGDQGFPSMVSDGTGGAVVAWDDGRGADLDIYAQRVNGSGAAQWTANGVAVCAAAGTQTAPRLVQDGTGGADLVWSDLRNGVDYDAYAGRINGTGAPQWAANGVALCAAPGNPVAPDLVPDGFGGAIATWDDLRSASDVYARRVDNSGTALWDVNGVRILLGLDDETNLSMISDGAGGVIIVWQESFRGVSDLYAQHVDAIGVRQWNADGVPVCTAAGSQSNPAAATDGAGGAIIAWNDDRSDPADIYVQRINAAGLTQWTSTGVALATAANFQYFPVIVPDGAAGAVVVWTDTRAGAYDVYARRVSSAGAPLWTANGVALCTTTGDQYNPSIDTDGAGGVIACWEDHRAATSDIYARRVNAAGTAQWLGNGVPVCAAAGDQTVPRLVADGIGGAIMTWQDERANTDIYTQRISSTGVNQWTADGVVVSGNSSIQGRPSIVTDQANGAIIAWHDLRNGYADVYAQRVNGSGVSLWTADGVALCTDPADQGNTVLASNGAGGAIVEWSDFRYGLEEDVFVRQVNSAGVPQGPADGQAVCVQPSRQLSAVMVPDGAGGAFAAWQDLRTGRSWDVYAHRIVPGGPVAVPSVSTSGRISLGPAVPNPTGGAATFLFRLAERTRVSLSIYDLQGRRVRALIDGPRAAGEGSARWDGRDESGRMAPSGIYLCRLEADGIRLSRRLIAIR